MKLLPAIIIRELVANALIHQDFTQTGTSVMIEIYGNRVEISNPGEPVVEVDRFIDGYRSRNERLASLMRRLGICEEIGRWRELGLADSTVDRLLKSPNVELLKRYRNGTFHFQTNYFDQRFTGFWKSQDSIPWVRELNLAFGTYFRREAKKGS